MSHLLYSTGIRINLTTTWIVLMSDRHFHLKLTCSYKDSENEIDSLNIKLLNDNQWEDLEAHMAGRGEGNSLGGVLFGYMDEWWKANSDLPQYVQQEMAEWYAEKSHIYKNLQPENHDEVPQFGLPFLDGWSYEEWFGLVDQGDGSSSPFQRRLRPSYYIMKDIWTRTR